MTDWRGIEAVIRDAAHNNFELAHSAAVGGGDINAAYRLQGKDGARYFVKLNDARHLPMFVAETEGLQAIAATRAIRVPRPIACGSSGGQCYLVLEHLEFSARGNARLLGEQLAKLHHFTSDRLASAQPSAQEVNSDHSRPGCSATPCHGRTAARFGFAHDNFIGTTAQPNAWLDEWVDFLRERRLGFQLQLAADNGHGGKLQDLGAELLERLPSFFAGYAPQPSLLHGDLWGGNHAYLADASPVVFDPAVYYGDRECDLAMTELFGGYPAEFYAGYRAAWPLDAGYGTRKRLYNLYHLLNHANLFGTGYAVQATQTITDLLARL